MSVDWFCRFVPDERRQSELRRLQNSGLFERVWQRKQWLLACFPAAATGIEWQQLADLGLLFTHASQPVIRDLLSGGSRLVTLAETAPEHLDQVGGEFNFVRLLGDGRAVVVRSCDALAPWYVRVDDEAVTVSTRLDWIGMLQREPPVLDHLACLMRVQSPSFLEPRTALCGSQVVPRGCFATLSSQGCRVGRYWKPEPLTLPEPSSEHARFVGRRLRQLLDTALSDQLASEGNLLLFSGGLDSSLLAALADEQGLPLHAVSLLPPLSDPVAPREEAFVALPGKIFQSHTQRRANRETLLHSLRLLRLQPAGGNWAIGIEACNDRSYQRIISGYLADECFGTCRVAEWINSTSPCELPAMLRNQEQERPLLRRWLGRKLRGRRHHLMLDTSLPEFMHPELRREYAALIEDERRAERERPGFCLTQALKYLDFVGVYAEAAKAMGAQAVIPFSSREVIELAFQTHPAELFDKGMAKMPLRFAGQDCLRQEILERRGHGVWSSSLNRQRPLPEFVTQLADWLDTDWVARQAFTDEGSLITLTILDQFEGAQKALSREQAKYTHLS